jgi:hypothetical protein
MFKYDHWNFQSEYLCQYCGELVYVDEMKSDKGICINTRCIDWPIGIKSILEITETGAPKLYDEIRNTEENLKNEIKTWKPGALIRYAYRGRKELISSFFVNGVMPLLDEFIAIGEMMLLTRGLPSEGIKDDIDQFRLLLDKIKKWSRDQRNLEDIRSGRIVFANTEFGLRPLLMKSAKAFYELQKGFGIVSNRENLSDVDIFPYTDLENAITPHIDFSKVKDGNDLLQPFWLLSLQMRYWLQEHYRTKQQYNYTPDILDFTVLFGWWLTTIRLGRDKTAIIDKEKEVKEKSELQRHFSNQSQKSYSAMDFFNTYIDSDVLVPVAVRTPEGIIMDADTLLFFLIYLQGCPDPIEPAISKRDELLTDMKNKVAEKFEGWLRDELHQRGYTGPSFAVKDNVYEYDIIAISEEKKKILIADAKYRDMAPSSFTAENLLNQELLGGHALRAEAEREQARLDHFRTNLETFNDYLKPIKPWEEYKIQAFLVTKQIPLANQYKEVAILRAFDFFKTS